MKTVLYVLRDLVLFFDMSIKVEEILNSFYLGAIPFPTQAPMFFKKDMEAPLESN